jgi:hypothetical protein
MPGACSTDLRKPRRDAVSKTEGPTNLVALHKALGGGWEAGEIAR